MYASSYCFVVAMKFLHNSYSFDDLKLQRKLNLSYIVYFKEYQCTRLKGIKRKFKHCDISCHIFNIPLN